MKQMLIRARERVVLTSITHIQITKNDFYQHTASVRSLHHSIALKVNLKHVTTAGSNCGSKSLSIFT